MPSRSDRCSNRPDYTDTESSDFSCDSLDEDEIWNNLNTLEETAKDMITDPAIQLPPYHPLSKPNFMWSENISGEAFTDDIMATYHEIVHWKKNIFMVPSGRAGEDFVKEMSLLFRSYGESTAEECVSLMAAMVIPSLLLQKPHPKSKTKDHIRCFERRLTEWKQGNIPGLVSEGRSIQQRLKKKLTMSAKDTSRIFSRLMMKGKVKAAMKLIAKEKGHLLSIYDPLHPNNPDDTRTVLDELRSKHPPSTTPNPEVIIDDQPNDFHPVIFDAVDGEAILRSALRTQGSAGPSGLDANA